MHTRLLCSAKLIDDAGTVWVRNVWRNQSGAVRSGDEGAVLRQGGLPSRSTALDALWGEAAILAKHESRRVYAELLFGRGRARGVAGHIALMPR